MLQLTSLLNFDRLNQIERELDIKISYLALILCVCVCVWQRRVSRPLRVSDYSFKYMQSRCPTHSRYNKEESHRMTPRF